MILLICIGMKLEYMNQNSGPCRANQPYFIAEISSDRFHQIFGASHVSQISAAVIEINGEDIRRLNYSYIIEILIEHDVTQIKYKDLNADTETIARALKFPLRAQSKGAYDINIDHLTRY